MTKTALICPLHNLVWLNRDAVRYQALEPDAWRCPICGLAADYVEYAMKLFPLGCLNCHAALDEKPCVYDSNSVALFCGVSCREAYKQQVAKANVEQMGKETKVRRAKGAFAVPVDELPDAGLTNGD